MQITEVIEVFKTQEALAEQLGIRQPSVARWVKKDFIPKLRQLQIEAVTGGLLKAEKGILPRKKIKSKCAA